MAETQNTSQEELHTHTGPQVVIDEVRTAFTNAGENNSRVDSILTELGSLFEQLLRLQEHQRQQREQRQQDFQEWFDESSSSSSSSEDLEDSEDSED